MKTLFFISAIVMLFGSLKKPDVLQPCTKSMKVKYYVKGKYIKTLIVDDGIFWVSKLDANIYREGKFFVYADSLVITPNKK